MRESRQYREAERRSYIRLDTVFPVQYRILGLQQDPIAPWAQGFTSDVSKTGIKLCSYALSAQMLALLRQPGVQINLEIILPLSRAALIAQGEVIWLREEEAQPRTQYLAGVRFLNIAPAQQDRLIRYALWKKWFLPVLVFFLLLFGCGFLLLSFRNERLRLDQRVVSGKLETARVQTRQMRLKLREVEQIRRALRSNQVALALAVEQLNAAKLEAAPHLPQLRELGVRIDALFDEKAALQSRLDSVLAQAPQPADAPVAQKAASFLVGEESLGLYRWLLSRRNAATGLVEGADKGVALLYDQALAAQVFLLSGDVGYARALFDFFDKQALAKNGPLFFGAYGVADAKPVSGETPCGPNIWLGIALAKYALQTQDSAFVPLARSLAKELILSRQAGSIDSGEWALLENNLDAYSFFELLFGVTGELAFARERDLLLERITAQLAPAETIVAANGEEAAVRAWALESLGPQKLIGLGLDPGTLVSAAQDQLTPVLEARWGARLALALGTLADFQASLGEGALARSRAEEAQRSLVGLRTAVSSSPSVSSTAFSLFARHRYHPSQDFPRVIQKQE